VAISDIKDPKVLAALFEVDTNYGRWHGKVEFANGSFFIGGHTILFFDSANGVPAWGDMGVELVIDCTGRATKREVAQQHIDKGAKKVLVSGPSKTKDDCDAVILCGINEELYDPSKHHIVSMGSCTTNALAPLIKVMSEKFGPESARVGHFLTVHAYTNTQSLTDQPMKDMRDSWAATENIIPSDSGAAKALSYIWPGLDIKGGACRVPVRTGSIVYLYLTQPKPLGLDDVKEAFREASGTGPLYGVLDFLEGEYASSRIVGDPHSCIVDLPLISATRNGNIICIPAWYDNEWGFSVRLVELARKLLTT
jgi:glyceraldehyde 3-phosphate dehydrogenase